MEERVNMKQEILGVIAVFAISVAVSVVSGGVDSAAVLISEDKRRTLGL